MKVERLVDILLRLPQDADVCVALNDNGEDILCAHVQHIGFGESVKGNSLVVIEAYDQDGTAQYN